MTLVVKKVSIKLYSDLWNRAGMMEILWTCAKLFVDIIPFFGCNCEVQKIGLKNVLSCKLLNLALQVRSHVICLPVNLHLCKFLFQNLDAHLNLRSVPCQKAVECVHQLPSFGEYLRIAIQQERKNNCFYSSQKLTSNYQKRFNLLTFME